MTSTSGDAGPSTLSYMPSATTSAVSPGFEYEYVEEFFRYRPKTLHKAKNHTISPNTRPPAFFDRHLDPSLQLLHVVYLPSITKDLMSIADDALETARQKGTLPLRDPRFPNPDVREAATPSIVGKIISEAQIQSIYQETTANFCACVAATLEFQLPAWGAGPLQYTSSSDKARGIADGFLTLENNPHHKTRAFLECYESVSNTFSNLALWEFKSLAAGTLEVMEAIIQQAVGCLAFPWEGCKLGKACVADQKHTGKDGLPIITGNRMGPDAEPPVCVSINSTPPKPGVPSGRLSDHARKSAVHILQQTWSEAVQEDATFVIINAGNLEIIGIRNRRRQTLFLSDVIKVDYCDYGRLHTGLYIAILRDAANRSLQLKLPDIPASWKKLYEGAAVTKMTGAEILDQACLRDWLIMDPLSNKTSLTGFKLRKYHFRVNPSKELKDNTKNDLLSFFRVALDTEFGNFIAKGTLEVDGNRSRSQSNVVIVKIAHNDDAIAKLHKEYEVYLDLLKAGVSELPRIIGFFHYVDIEDSEVFPLRCAVLVMQDVGIPICHAPEHFTRENLTLFQDLLRKIHKAGIVHTNLSRENLIIRGKTPAKVSIVSFGDARRVSRDQARAFDADNKRLLELIPNQLKHTLDGKPKTVIKDTAIRSSGVRDTGVSKLESSRKKSRKE